MAADGSCGLCVWSLFTAWLFEEGKGLVVRYGIMYGWVRSTY